MALDQNINRIKFFRSTTPGAKPALADLQDGELALNMADRVIYTRSGSNIVDMGFGLGGTVNGPVTITGALTATLTGNATSATRLQTARTINDVSFDGTSNIKIPGWFNVISQNDNRTIKPNEIRPLSLAVNFTTLGGMNDSTASGDWADLISLNTHADSSGGQVNALLFAKSGTQKILHYRAAVGATVWGTPKEVAYTDSSITGNSATSSRPETARYVTMGGTTAWKRIATFTSGGSGYPLKINFVGGAGFNSLTSQMRNSSILIKQGNTNNSTSFEYVYDDTTVNPFGEVILRNTGTNTWEIWALVTAYSTYYMWADFPNAVVYTHNWDSETTTKPTGTISSAAPTKINAFTSSNVASATKLQTARTINGVSFDGTANITIDDSTKLPLSGGTLTGGLVGTTAEFSGTVKVGSITSTNALSILNASGAAQNISAGGVLISNAYADANLVPANGVYSRGIIQGNTGIAINNTNTLGHGIGLYNGDCGNATNLPNYGMALGLTSQYGLHGALTGQYAVYLTCSQTGNPRGWIFKSASSGTANAASITNDGAFSANRGYYLTNNLNNNIRVGNGDGASYATHNLIIQSHWGIGFRSNTDTATLLMDTRVGNLSMAGTMASNTATCNTLNVSTINNADLDVLMYSPVAYAGTVPPTGWLAMMGQTITQAQYPKLFALYGGTLPDMRANVIRGWDNGRGIDVNRSILSQQFDAIENITGSLGSIRRYTNTDAGLTGAFYLDGGVGQSITGAGGTGYPSVGFDASRVVKTASETRMRNIAFNYIVKAG